MNVLIFEWLNGGGLWHEAGIPQEICPFQQQGAAMLRAVADDFLRIGHNVCVLKDSRIQIALPSDCVIALVDCSTSLVEGLKAAAETADKILLIAPESDGCLLKTHDWLHEFPTKIISPDRAFVELTSNKTSTANFLSENAISVPKGMLIDECDRLDDVFRFPSS